jgi:hypothetical protein
LEQLELQQQLFLVLCAAPCCGLSVLLASIW